MSVEETKKVRKRNVPRKAAESTKKIGDKKVPQKKIDFIYWLDQFNTGIQIDKLSDGITHLNSEYRNIAIELVQAISETNIKPNSKFRIEKLSNEFLNVLVNKGTNPFYLIALLCSSVTDLELKRKILTKLKSHSFTEEYFEYFINRMTAIKDVQNRLLIWNELLSSEVLTEEGWQPFQLRMLDWGLSQKIQITKPQELFIAFRSAAQQFKNMDTTYQNRFYKKLLELDILTFIAFVLHISAELPDLKLIKQILDQKKRDFLLVYFQNRQLLVGSWLDLFEQKIVKPILIDTLDRVMNFEDLLPFLMKQSQLSHLVETDTLSRAVSRSFMRDDLLSDLLRDVRVDKLSSQIEILSKENLQLSVELNNEKYRTNENEKRIRDFETAINSYEISLRSQMKSENLGTEAMSQSAKVEVIKALVDGVDHLLHDSEGFVIERALQKMGIMKLGDPGSIFTWDSELCETLTGESIDQGLVVRSGYTWLNGDKKVVIRRVLLKLS